MAYPDLHKEKSYSWLNVVLILICLTMFGYGIFYFSSPESHNKLMERLDIPGALASLNDQINDNNEEGSKNKESINNISLAAPDNELAEGRLTPLNNATENESLVVAPLPSSNKFDAEIKEKNLPMLNESDPLFLGSLENMSELYPLVSNYLLQSGLLQSTVVFIDNFSRGTFIASFSPLVAPTAPFKVIDNNNGEFIISEESYRRYDDYIDYFVSLDDDKIIEAYNMFKPLINKAYSEISRPGSRFDVTLNNAIEVALRTPIVDEPIYLTSPAVMFLYADPKLESLNHAQKLLLRLGAKNLNKLQQKLSDIQILLKQQQQAEQKANKKDKGNEVEESWQVEN
jgi:hypothetical protein